MHIRATISRSFLIVSGHRSVDQARQLLSQTGPRYLVVTLGEALDSYLLAAREFEERVATLDPALSLQESGLLRGRHPASVHYGQVAKGSVDPCLVMEDGMLVGILASRHALKPLRLAGSRPVQEEVPEDAHGLARFVRATLPSEISAGDSVILAVELGTAPSVLKIEVPGGSELDLMVQPKEGLRLEGSGYATLHVPAPGDTASVEFRMRAETPGPGLVRVYIFHEGSALGSLTLQPTIQPLRDTGTVKTPVPLLSAGSMLAGAPPPSVADLSLLILEERVGRQPVLRIRVTARDPELGLNLKEFGPIQLQMEPVEYFRNFFEDVEAGLRRRSTDLVRHRLESKGARLYESIFPEALREIIWDLRDRIGAVQIQSDEAWIPWELCRLTGVTDGVVVEDRFFCEAFAVTRWIPGIARRPRLSLNNMAVIVPSDSRLKWVKKELAFLHSLAHGGRSVQEVPARYVDVRSALAAGTFDGFHFSGHGFIRISDPDHSAIQLEGSDELRPEEISGVLRNLGRSRPIVFLNSCQGARGALTLVGTGGWARRCLDAGAGAFVGAYWPVSDRAACGFAQAFYREVHKGKSLGAAVQAAREAIRTPGDPTWLAYTIFGDPAAVVEPAEVGETVGG